MIPTLECSTPQKETIHSLRKGNIRHFYVRFGIELVKYYMFDSKNYHQSEYVIKVYMKGLSNIFIL